MKTKNRCINVMKAFLTTAAFCYREETGWFSMMSVVCLAVFFGFYETCAKIDMKVSKWDNILALLFSFSMILGKSFSTTNSMEAITGSAVRFILNVIFFAGYNVAFLTFIRLVYTWMAGEHHKNAIPVKMKWLSAFEKAPLICSFVIILICWLPDLIAFFPGRVVWDGLRSLTYYYGKAFWSNHHPYAITVLMGGIMDIGKLIFKSDEMGFFGYNILQSLFVIYNFAYTVAYFVKRRTKWGLCFGMLAFFALIPVWPAFSYCYLKDMIHCALILRLVLLLFDKMHDKEYNVVKSIILSAAICITRNSGIYVVFVTWTYVLIMQLIKEKKLNKQVLSINVMVICMWILYMNLFLPWMGIDTSEKKEMLSIPFQQTARYARDAGDASDEEKAVISKVLNDYESLAGDYNPELSDPIKNKCDDNATTQEYIDYFKVWGQQFLRHPGIYIEATINNIYGYIYPDKEPYFEGIGSYAMCYSEAVNPDQYLSYGYKSFYGLGDVCRKIIEKWAKLIQKLPGVGMVYSCGFYSWVLALFVVGVLRMRKCEYLTVAVPACMVLLINFASPVNAYIRYMLPIMAITPILIVGLYEAYQNMVKVDR